MRLRDFQQDFNRNFKKIAALFENVAEDLLESMNQEQVRRVFGSALDLVRPYHLAIGARVRRLGRAQIEVLIPAKSHNLNSKGFIEEGILVSQGMQMCQLLLARWEWGVECSLESASLNLIAPLSGDLIARLEWDQLSREALRSELLAQAVSSEVWTIFFYNREEQKLADLTMTFQLRLSPTLKGEA